jgi:hypothetical protein
MDKFKTTSTFQAPATSKRLHDDSAAEASPRSSPESSSAKRVKVHLSRGQEENENELQPGRAEDPMTFVQLHTTEGLVSIYTDYSRRDEFRKFAMSAWVLEPHVQAFTDRRQWQMRRDRVLPYIQRNVREMKSDEKPIIKYPLRSDGLHVTQRTALAIVQMHRRLQDLGSNQPHYSQEDQDAAATQFQQLTGKTPPRVDISSIKLKNFGPHTTFGEGPMEPFNRCLNVLMYVNFSLRFDHWKAKFESKKWDQPVIFTTGELPHWMCKREDRRIMHQAPTSSTRWGLSSPSFQVTVVWEINSIFQIRYAPELWQHIQNERRISDPVRTATVDLEPTTSAAEFHDKIRIQFSMALIGAQIATLHMRPTLVDMLDAEWSTVRDALRSFPNPSVCMALRKTEAGENIWETRSGTQIVSRDQGSVFSAKNPTTTQPALQQGKTSRELTAYALAEADGLSEEHYQVEEDEHEEQDEPSEEDEETEADTVAEEDTQEMKHHVLSTLPSATAPTPPIPSITVNVIWKMQCRLLQAREMWQHMVDTGLEYKLIPQARITLLHGIADYQFRDLIRQAFKLEEMGGQIFTLQIRPSFTNILETRWAEVWDELAGEAGADSVVFMTLRRRREDEELLEGKQVWGYDE